MLLAFADESGHAADPKVDHVGLVGLIAPEERWATFRNQWNAALAAFGIDAFHMREFAHRRGAFQDWPEERRRALLDQLLAAIEELQPTIVGSVISLQAWRALDSSDQRLFLDPYYACIQEFAYLAAVHATTVGQDDVRITLSQNSEFAGRAKSLFDALSKSQTMPRSVRDYQYADMRTEPALQAADLVAYEVVLGHDQVSKGAVKLRHPFERLRRTDMFVRYIEDTWLAGQVRGARE
jgi:hypothetical protein